MKYLSYILILLLMASCNNDERRDEKPLNDEYTCPMHPEIIKPQPGQCPVCGMDLVKKEKASRRVFTCPMHPEIVRNQPGRCPVCGMDLVEKQTGGTGTSDTAVQFLLKPTNQFVVSNVKTVALSQKQLPAEIKATGIIDYDTRFINSVSARVNGRIEKLYVKYRFQPVKKGEKLMEIYSEDIATEQQNYIYLLANDASNTGIISSAETKLELLGLNKDQIQQLKKSRKVQYTVTVFSPYSGHLHENGSFQNQNTMDDPSMPQQQLSIREGMYVQKGQTVFNIYNTENLWAVMNIPAESQSALKKDQSLELYVDGVKEPLKAKVDFIEPSIRPGRNFVTVRAHISNPHNDLKIGAIVHATFQSSEKNGYFLPATAVLNLGRSNVVFVMKEKLLEAREVITGLKTKDRVEIISGLNKNEKVAENAQLLIDSEAFVRTGKQ